MLLYLRVGNSQESFAKPPKGKPWCAQGPDAILMNSLERYGGESGTLWNQADNYNVLWLCRELLVQVTVSTGSLFLSAVLQRELHNPLLNIHTSDLFPSPPVCVSSTAGCWSHPLPPVNLISVALLTLFSCQGCPASCSLGPSYTALTWAPSLPSSLSLSSACSYLQVLSSQ